MSSAIQPIVLHGAPLGPNPSKIVMLFEELGLPYEHRHLDFSKVKQEPFLSLNPNGRLPAIEDPNTGITLWESGAIIEYIIETYDKDNKLSIATFPEKFHLKQWLHFQMSGQGPYYGQYIWFSRHHPEKLPSAVERYEQQILRVVSVLDKALEGKEYLVGNKFTYADLALISWEHAVHLFHPDLEAMTAKYQNYTQWLARLNGRPAIRKANDLVEGATKRVLLQRDENGH
ncbi:glutathione transferase 1 [Microdochium bolleyi]|uniref:glutathione transferase n=1 Tax=Microdochium bolleyi TaxID=196109 RepID=A0A136JBU1_9PEZI|nr:glutathione transferase 1 [Microdochium bolleyi]